MKIRNIFQQIWFFRLNHNSRAISTFNDKLDDFSLDKLRVVSSAGAIDTSYTEHHQRYNWRQKKRWIKRWIKMEFWHIWELIVHFEDDLCSETTHNILLSTHFQPMFHFYTPWKHQKTSGPSSMFSGGIEVELSLKMG